MQIARVIGTVVATQKHRTFEGAKLMLVQPLNIDDTPRGDALLAVDGVGAGVDEKVLVVLEGRAAGEALGRRARRWTPRSSASSTRSRSMTDQELRAMIRESIARHAGSSAGAPVPGAPDAAALFRAHVSHLRLPLVRGGDEDGACLIEPAVRCNHCGFCQSLGH